jgi:hypothetical protein
LCFIYTGIAVKLYADAAAFDASFAGMVTNKLAFAVRLEVLRSAGTDWILMLGVVVGLTLVNLMLLLTRHPGLHGRRRSASASALND